MKKEEALVWIRDFLIKIDNQDNRGTANPILFLLQTKQEYVAHPEFNHNTRTVFHHYEMENGGFETIEEAKQWLINYGYEDERLKEEIEHIQEFQMGHHWDTQQAFFTEDGLKQHIELNGHNLRGHRDYVVHCFRNPEIANLFKALRAVNQDYWSV